MMWMMISVGTEFICCAGRAVSFPVIMAIDIFSPGAPSSRRHGCLTVVDLRSGFPSSSVEVAAASCCLFMNFQGVLIGNQGKVSQTLLACFQDSLEVSYPRGAEVGLAACDINVCCSFLRGTQSVYSLPHVFLFNPRSLIRVTADKNHFMWLPAKIIISRGDL